MRYFIIAGEASGDLHASHVAGAIRQLDPSAELQGWGGDLMEAAGVGIKKHIRELAFMGFVEVVKNLGAILRNFTLCKQQIGAFRPDTVVFVDYPGFNLRMAKWAKKQGYTTVYYISPTVWAWKENRIETIRRYVDRMICILPFEKAFYAQRHLDVDYVGHPSVDVVAKAMETASPLQGRKILALLPGSRKQEIDNMLPVMLKACEDISDYELVIAQAPNLDIDVYRPFLTDTRVSVMQHRTYDILKVAHAALVTSGTATLEAALFRVPQVVCYIANPVSYAIARRLVRVKYISLVNLILDRESVTELIQSDLTVARLKAELRGLVYDEARRSALQADYAALAGILQQGGAAEKTAGIIVALTFKQQSKNDQHDRE